LKYSLVAVTVRDVDALEPLFRVSDSDAELIIIDSRYDVKKLEELRKLEHSFQQVTYAPPKVPIVKRKYDLVSALNTGYSYAEGDIFIRVDDWMELYPDFFERLNETMAAFTPLFGDDFVVREYDCTEMWKNDMKNAPSGDGFIPITRRYYTMPFRVSSTAGLTICHRSVMFDVNGFDERYDDGTGWNDNDMACRVLAGWKYLFIFDSHLMVYRHPHVAVAPWERIINQKLCMEVFVNELLNGEYRSKNSVSLEELHRIIFSGKEQYRV
jgi:glycosyltransferase involved in cell wall biosynthesis